MSKKIELTKRQKEVLDFIVDYKAQHDYAPSFQDIADHFKFGKTAVKDHLDLIQKKGHIQVSPNVARGIKLL